MAYSYKVVRDHACGSRAGRCERSPHHIREATLRPAHG